MILTTLCLDVIYLTGTIYEPKSAEKGLHRFGIVWLHILQYQKGGVRQVLLITLNVFWDVINHIYNAI